MGTYTNEKEAYRLLKTKLGGDIASALDIFFDVTDRYKTGDIVVVHLEDTKVAAIVNGPVVTAISEPSGFISLPRTSIVKGYTF